MKRSITEAEFIEAYDAYADALFRYCYFRVYDRERAKELLQETFTRSWDYLAKGNEIDNLKAFLYKAAHNLCVNEQVRSKALSLDEIQESVGFDPADETARSPEQDAELMLLMRRLSELRPADRDLLTFRYLDGMPVQEIAELLEEEPNTISVRLRRAQDALRKKMEPI